MPAWMDQSILYAYTIIPMALLIIIEAAYSYKKKLHLYTLKDSLVSGFYALCQITLDKLLMFGTMMLILGWCWNHRITVIEPTWLYWVLLLLLQDFAYWAEHTVDHKVRLFWAIHITHHNSDKYNLTTGFRSSVFQPLYRFVYFMPIALLGYHPLHIMFMYAATQIYGNLVHTQAINKMGFLEKFMVTPSHHRVHHASNVPYLDKNMGMLFIWWDKMFGTFEQEGRDPEPLHFGLFTPPATENPVVNLFSEFGAIWRDASQPNLTMAQRFKYIFGAPGWSHDGHKHTSAQMQREWVTQHPLR